MHVLAAALAILAVGAAHTASASADVCTGGAPYEASGPAGGVVGGAVPFLASPRWSKETLPQWSETLTSSDWGNQLAFAWYPKATLWGATSTAAWWVIPGLACTDTDGPEAHHSQDGNLYVAQVCVVVLAQLSLISFDCQGAKELSRPSSPVSVKHDAQRLVSGFAPRGTGSVEVLFQSGHTTFPVAGGVYGGSVSARVGKAVSATDIPAVVTRARTPVVLVDQTGLYSSSQGPLASTPRLKKVAAAIHARIPSVRASILGTAVSGHRARDEVLYGPGAHALASRVARALHAQAPSALAAGASRMFGSVARVVVLVGRSN
jgi:hypothetical protein